MRIKICFLLLVISLLLIPLALAGTVYINTADGNNQSIGNENNVFIDNTNGIAGIGTRDTLYRGYAEFPADLTVGDGIRNFSGLFKASMIAIVGEISDNDVDEGVAAIIGLVRNSTDNVVVKGDIAVYLADVGWAGMMANYFNSSGGVLAYLALNDTAVKGLLPTTTLSGGYGGYFEASGDDGVGVIANASGDCADFFPAEIGIFSCSDGGFGAYGAGPGVAVYGVSSGVAAGIYGDTSVTAGYGVRGTGALANSGNIGYQTSTEEVGVYGSAASASGTYNYGVYGTATKATVNRGVHGNSSIGVYGLYTSDPTNYGYLGSVDYGVFGGYDANTYGFIGSAEYGLAGNATSGNGYGIYARGWPAGGKFVDTDDSSDVISFMGITEYSIDGTIYDAGAIGIDTDNAGFDLGIIGIGLDAGMRGCDANYDCDSEVFGYLGFASYASYGYSSVNNGYGMFGTGGSSAKAGVYGVSSAAAGYGIYASSSSGTAVYSFGSTQVENGGVCIDSVTDCTPAMTTAGDFIVLDGSFCVASGLSTDECVGLDSDVSNGDVVVADGAFCVDSGGSLCDNYLGSDGGFYMTAHGTTTSSANGYITPANGYLNISTGSSGRYKEKIVDSEFGLDAVMMMRPVLFDYKEGYVDLGQLHNVGLIAEEMEGVSPMLVDYTFIRLDDGTGKTVPENVRYPIVNVPVIKAIQEQQGNMALLDSRLGSLESELGSLLKLAGEMSGKQ